MRSRLTISLLALVLVFTAYSVARTQQNPFRLKNPDQRALCLSCHTDFEQTLKKRFVHSAVKAGDCADCHSPHTSDHGKLLADDASKVCAGCHDVVPASPKSTHKVVTEGECLKCHDPHASDNASNLKMKGNELCVSCHKEIGEAVTKAKFKHNPVEQGCVTCHGPHGSDKAGSLLKDDVPGLCVTCHKPDNPTFVTRHLKYQVGKANCTSCHDPHGSDNAALLYNNVHPPVGTRMCNQCHEGPESATPFATKRTGFELCKGCHNDMVGATMAKARLHWPIADKKGCLNCHNPHAAKQDKLLKADIPTLCSRCHADTMRAFAATAEKHAPVKDGMCTACHSPHSAANPFLFDQPSVNETCAQCHDYEQHSAHPIGEKAVDPRNKNLHVDCRSCHKGHGTDFKRMLLAPTNVELCTQCHKKFSR